MSEWTVINKVEANQPGTEVGLVTPLRVDVGDTVILGNVSETVSDSATMTVSGKSINTTPVVVGDITYPAGQAVIYTLAVTGSLAADRTVSILWNYTTQTGDVRKVRQYILLRPHHVATGGVTAFGGGTITQLTTAPAAALYPGLYDINTAGGAFTVLLQQVAGEWIFLDAANTTATNNLTIGTSSQTFNGSTGPLVMDGSVGVCRVYASAGGTAFKVVV